MSLEFSGWEEQLRRDFTLIICWYLGCTCLRVFDITINCPIPRSILRFLAHLGCMHLPFRLPFFAQKAVCLWIRVFGVKALARVFTVDVIITWSLPGFHALFFSKPYADAYTKVRICVAVKVVILARGNVCLQYVKNTKHGFLAEH